MADGLGNALIRARIMVHGKIVEPLKETLDNDDGMSELVQTLMIAGLVVVAIGAIVGGILIPKLKDSAVKTGDLIGGFDANTYKP